MASRPGQPDTCLRPPVRRGFTLIEMSISLAILSMLLVAIGSAIMLAAKTLPQGSNASSETSTAAMTIEDIASELQFALDFNERSATEVEFTVADRDSDGIRETIRYVLDGVDLERHYNGGSGLDVLEDVEEFELVYETAVRTETIPTIVESGEVSLAADWWNAGGAIPFLVTAPEWIGQYFQPGLMSGNTRVSSLPPDTITWKVTRVEFRPTQDGLVDGSTKVQLRTVDAGRLPTTTIIDEEVMFETDFSGSFHEISFSNAGGLDPGMDLCLVFEWVSGVTSVRMLTHNASGEGRVETLDGGGSWSTVAPGHVLYKVFGTYTQPGTMNVNRTYLTGIRIKLRTGAETATLVQTSTPLLHVKEITP